MYLFGKRLIFSKNVPGFGLYFIKLNKKEKEVMFKQYWVQGVKDNKMKVVLKTNILNKAINKLKANHDLFIWDCISRSLVKANHNCIIK